MYIATVLTSISLVIQGFDSPAYPQQQNTWQWINRLGGSSWDISAGLACDSKNNIFLSGSFYGNLDCNSEKLSSYGNSDIFIARFDADGSLKALSSCGGKGYDRATCLCITVDDIIITGGVITDTATFGNIIVPGRGRRPFIAAISEKGRFVWVRTFNTTGEASLNSIGTDMLGNIYVSGIFTGNLGSDNQELKSNGRKDIFLARLSTSGTVEKMLSFGSAADESPGYLSADINGNVVLAAAFEQPFEAGKLQLSLAPEGTRSNIFLAKFDSDFNVLWTSLISGDDYVQVASLKHDKTGSLYLTGSFNSKIQVADTILISEGYTDIFICKYSPDGKLEWGRSLGSWYYDYANHVNADKLGGAVISGSIGDKLTVDSLIIESGSMDNSAFMIQFSSGGDAIWADCISGRGRSFGSGSATDKQGNLCFSGSFRGNLEKGSDIVTSLGDQDIYVAKYFNCQDTEAEISGQLSFCHGTGTELGVKKDYANIVWNDTITGKHFIVADRPGKYWVSMFDIKGCLLTDTVLVTENELPVFTLGKDTTLLVEDSLFLSVPAGYNQYQWNDCISEPVCLVRSVDGKAGTSEYWLKVTDSLNCVYSDTISVTFMTGPSHQKSVKTQLITYPNPAKYKINWYLKTDEDCRLLLDLTDARGRVLYHQVLERYLPGGVNEININNLSPGIYNLRVSNSTSGTRYKAVRFIKQ
jgi:hypothetical protein